jgi:hypothetical protein
MQTILPCYVVFLGIPFFIFEGDECYASFKVSLARMFREHRLGDTVKITLPDGS